MKKLTWIGTGIMGKEMAGHLLSAGYELTITTRTKEKAQALIDAGALWADSTAQAVKDADAVFTMVGSPQDVKDIYLGPQGILQNVKPNTITIDMTTSSAQVAQEIYEEGKKFNVQCLDAPVSGGETGAKNATLLIVVGGDQSAYEAIKPCLDLMGKSIFYMGSAGCGQNTKMANQIAVAGSLAACTEAIVYAKLVGLDPAKVVEAISLGSGASYHLKSTAPKILAEDYRPGFYIKHFVKDMGIAKEEILRQGAQFPMLFNVLKMYQDLLDEGYETLGTQALIKHYEEALEASKK